MIIKHDKREIKLLESQEKRIDKRKKIWIIKMQDSIRHSQCNVVEKSSFIDDGKRF